MLPVINFVGGNCFIFDVFDHYRKVFIFVCIVHSCAINFGSTVDKN